MEVEMPKSPDFFFSSPYASAPSSPKPLGSGQADEFYYCYTSAPASPSRAAAVYSFMASEMKAMTAPQKANDHFNFDFGDPRRQEELISISTADELFDKGQIRPKKPSPSSHTKLPPKSPRLLPRGFWSPQDKEEETERGRALLHSVASKGSRRESRSLSPLRGGGDMSFQKTHVSSSSNPSTSITPASAATTPLPKSSGGSRKWRLKDLLLFRSASEGRATGRGSKDPLRKYTMLSSFNKRKPSSGGDQDSVKSGASFKSTDSFSTSTKPVISAHELHYTMNRAASEEQKKRTPLPYHRNTLFGCLHFNPAVRSFARGFNSNSFSRQ